MSTYVNVGSGATSAGVIPESTPGVAMGIPGAPITTDGGPAIQLLAITPSDSTNLSTNKIRALRIGGAGNLAIKALNDSVATTLSVVAGEYIPISPSYVMATNTTCTGIVGLI